MFLPPQNDIVLDFQGHLGDHESPQMLCEFESDQTIHEYYLIASENEWEVGINQFFTSWTFNNSLPGSPLCAREGDTVSIEVENKLASDISFDLVLAENQTQTFPGNNPNNIIQSNESKRFNYDIPANTSGTWMYISNTGLNRGLYGALLIYGPQEEQSDHEIIIFQDDFSPPVTDNNDFFAVQNGKMFPYAPHYIFKEGERIRIRVINVLDALDHTIHVHGHTWEDEKGNNIDNELIQPGSAIDRVMILREPGMWMYHCHIYDHIAAGMTAMMTVIPKDYEGSPLDYVNQLMEAIH